MDLVLLVAVWFLAALWLLARCLATPDYPAMKDVELIRLHAAQKKRLAAAGKVSSDRYEAALERMGKLTAEMKQRGLLDADAFVDDHLTKGILECAAREKYSRGLGEIQALSAQGDPQGLYQLGMLFRIARENDVASRLIAQAAQAGDAEAQFAWALMLLGAGEEPAPDRQSEALTWLRIAADQGHGQAQLALAGLVKSLPTAVVWPALREARRRMKQSGIRPVRPASRPAATTTPSYGLLAKGAGQRSFG